MTSWTDMKKDLLPLGPMTRREMVHMWATYYWRPTRRAFQKIESWWHYSVLRYPKRPPFDVDPVALHLGFIKGVPPCTDGPRCAAHGLLTHGE